MLFVRMCELRKHSRKLADLLLSRKHWVLWRWSSYVSSRIRRNKSWLLDVILCIIQIIFCIIILCALLEMYTFIRIEEKIKRKARDKTGTTTCSAYYCSVLRKEEQSSSSEAGISKKWIVSLFILFLKSQLYSSTNNWIK